MKPAILLLLPILLSLATKPVPGAGDSAPEPVRDTDGNELRTGTEYYILPVIRGRGGGLTLRAGTRNLTCYVVQARQELSRGLPVTFHPVDPKEGVIRLITDSNIEFAAFSTCVQSTVWKIAERDAETGKIFVTIGGVKGNPGRETLGNWFRIEKYDKDYKLVFCPSVCDICRPLCGDLGIFIVDGVRRLALSDVPFKVMFKKKASAKDSQAVPLSSQE